MTNNHLLSLGATWIWLVALHSFLAGLVFFAWTRIERLSPGRSRRWLLSMILLLPLLTGTLALVRRAELPGSAWFDSGRLLNLTPIEQVRVVHLAWLAGGATLFVTMVQEVIPAFFPLKRSDHAIPEVLLRVARRQPGWEKIDVIMIDEHLTVAAGGTPWSPRLYLSGALAARFEEDEIEAAVRHEHAHLLPRRWWVTHLLFAARMMQPANPVAMWVSRELALEHEIACDSEAVGKDPRRLARVLFTIYEEPGKHDRARRHVLQRRIDVLLGRSKASHRVAQLPDASLVLGGLLTSLLLVWVT